MENTFSSSLNDGREYRVKIDDLAFEFAKKVVFLRKRLIVSEDKEYIISKQLVRSGTSIAANIAEAGFPQSDAIMLVK